MCPKHAWTSRNNEVLITKEKDSVKWIYLFCGRDLPMWTSVGILFNCLDKGLDWFSLSSSFQKADHEPKLVVQVWSLGATSKQGNTAICLARKFVTTAARIIQDAEELSGNVAPHKCTVSWVVIGECSYEIEVRVSEPGVDILKDLCQSIGIIGLLQWSRLVSGNYWQSVNVPQAGVEPYSVAEKWQPLVFWDYRTVRELSYVVQLQSYRVGLILPEA